MNAVGSHRWVRVAVVALLLLLPPYPTDAQSPLSPGRSTHARAPADADLLVRLDRAALFVPVGATAPGAVVALGVGGVPGGTGVVVSAAGSLRGELIVLLAPTRDDRGMIAANGGGAALADLAAGGHRLCLDAGDWLACPLDRPGAYLVTGVGVAEPALAHPHLADAIARVRLDTQLENRFVHMLPILLTAMAFGVAAVYLIAAFSQADERD